MLFDNYRLRRILIALFSIFILVLAANYIYGYLSKGRITVRTDNPTNYVKIEWALGGNHKSGSFSKQTQHELTVRVRPGTYQILVYDEHGLNGISRTVTLRARQSLGYTLNPAALLSPEPVYGGGVGGVFSDGSQLLFVALEDPGSDTSGDGNIMRAGTGGGLSPLSPDNFFSLVKWISPGAGLGHDTFNKLYAVRGGSVSQIKLPFPTDQNSKFSSDIASDGKVYVSDGQNVYVGSTTGNFKKIFSTDKDNPVSALFAGADKVAVVTNTVEALESKRSGGQAQGNIVVVSTAGGSVKKSEDVSAAAWSPDGAHVVAEGPLITNIYDADLRQTGSINVKNSSNFVWLNNTSVLYSVNNELWSYDTQSSQSSKIAQLTSGSDITSLYPDKNGSYVYISGGSGNNTQLFRVGLKGQHVDKSLAPLSTILPENIGVCSLNYINFTKPTITISYPEFETTSQLCLNAAKGELRYYNLNLSSLRYVVTPIVQKSD